MQSEIEQLYLDFAYARIGVVRAKTLPLQSFNLLPLKISKPPYRYFDKFTITLDGL